jgi:hypothetical protein
LLRTVGFGSSEPFHLAAAKLGIQEALIELHVCDRRSANHR